MRYGVWVRIEHWATVDGGPDWVGTRKEAERKVKDYTKADNERRGGEDLLPTDQIVEYVVRPYVGSDPIPFKQTSKPIKDLDTKEIQSRLNALSIRWENFLDSTEGTAGSPGEWMVEEMGELETELKRRVSKSKRQKK